MFTRILVSFLSFLFVSLLIKCKISFVANFVVFYVVFFATLFLLPCAFYVAAALFCLALSLAYLLGDSDPVGCSCSFFSFVNFFCAFF